MRPATAAPDPYFYSLYDDQSSPAQPCPSCRPGLQPILKQAYKAAPNNLPYTADRPVCCSGPLPCVGQVNRIRFQGCPVAYATGPDVECEVNPIPDRYKIGDLNPLIYERSRMQGQIWNPYRHMHARVAWMQTIAHDLNKSRDPNTRPIAKLEDAFCVRKKQQGPPAFVSF